MNNSLRYGVTPAKRSAQGTSAQSTPMTPSITKTTGSPPAGKAATRRSNEKSSVGINANSHNTARMPVAEVDQGSDTTSATASPSASRAKFSRLNALNCIGQLSN